MRSHFTELHGYENYTDSHLYALSIMVIQTQSEMICPLCEEHSQSLRQYQKHVAKHQEQLALFALPRDQFEELDVSASTSPIKGYRSESDYTFDHDSKNNREPEWEIRLPNFPSESAARQDWPCRIEELHISKGGQRLVGTIAVSRNDFQKYVIARFTFDSWVTVCEVVAEYKQAPGEQFNDAYDHFEFSIKLSDHANLQSMTMYICARFHANEQEHWDNNFGNNYQVNFQRKVPA
jgi:hypothetical protein